MFDFFLRKKRARNNLNLKKIFYNIIFVILAFSCLSADHCNVMASENTRSYTCVVDDHTRPLPGKPPEGWFYNHVGGDRGVLCDIKDTSAPGVAEYSQPKDSVYQGRIAQLSSPSSQWDFLGFWYALGHAYSSDPPNWYALENDNSIKSSYDPNAFFHSMILEKYQARITGIDILVDQILSPEGRSDLTLKVELKGLNTQDEEVIRFVHQWVGREDLVQGPFPKSFKVDIDPTQMGRVGLLLCILDKARVGDSLSIDSVRLQVEIPKLNSRDEAFLISLSMLLNNFDDQTGMVQDRSFYPRGVFENITATGKLAKILAMAVKKGMVDPVQAYIAVDKIANTLLHVVPRGPKGQNQLWPHFTRNGGTERDENTEWSSGDTAYAILDLCVALKLMGGMDTHLADALAFLKSINWKRLEASDGGIYHGYRYDGQLLESTWLGFGTETLGVLLAARSGGQAIGTMGPPPSDNGSGFIMHAGYPIIPKGTDIFNNNWDVLRENEVKAQIDWYTIPENANPFIKEYSLFGLSAADRPEGYHQDEGQIYQAYGIGGREEQANDGNHRVVVLHYSGMISSLRPDEFDNMWTSLKQLEIVSPMSIMESMAVSPVTGDIEQVNYMQGSWNLCLFAEGIAYSDPDIELAVRKAFFSIPEFRSAYNSLFPGLVSNTEKEVIIVSDGNHLIKISSNNPEKEIFLNSETDIFCNPQNPIINDGQWLWFDAESLIDKKRRGLWRKSLSSGIVELMTKDPWGSSYDKKPVPSPVDSGVLYITNRSGTTTLNYSCKGIQEAGFGNTVYGSNSAAVFDNSPDMVNVAYIANMQQTSHFSSYLLNCENKVKIADHSWSDSGELMLSSERLVMDPSGDRLLISTFDQGIYVKSIENGDAEQLMDYGREACFNSDGTRIAFVALPEGSSYSYLQLFVADISETGGVSNIQQVTNSNRDQRHPTFYSDTIPPAISITPTQSPTRQSFQTISGNREAGTEIVVEIDSSAIVGSVIYPNETSWQCKIQELQETHNMITVTGRDHLLNTSTLIVYIIYDITPPHLELVTGLSLVNHKDITIEGKSEHGVTIAVTAETADSVSAVTFTSDVDWVCNIHGLDEGLNQINITATDVVGNTETIQHEVTVDITPPLLELVALVSGESESLTNSKKVLLSVGGNDVVAYKWKLNDGQFSKEMDISLPIELDYLQEGIHTVTVAARDIAGNWHTEENVSIACGVSVKLGDTNSDNMIDVKDAIYILRVISDFNKNPSTRYLFQF